MEYVVCHQHTLRQQVKLHMLLQVLGSYQNKRKAKAALIAALPDLKTTGRLNSKLPSTFGTACPWADKLGQWMGFLLVADWLYGILIIGHLKQNRSVSIFKNVLFCRIYANHFCHTWFPNEFVIHASQFTDISHFFRSSVSGPKSI